MFLVSRMETSNCQTSPVPTKTMPSFDFIYLWEVNKNKFRNYQDKKLVTKCRSTT